MRKAKQLVHLEKLATWARQLQLSTLWQGCHKTPPCHSYGSIQFPPRACWMPNWDTKSSRNSTTFPKPRNCRMRNGLLAMSSHLYASQLTTLSASQTTNSCFPKKSKNVERPLAWNGCTTANDSWPSDRTYNCTVVVSTGLTGPDIGCISFLGYRNCFRGTAPVHPWQNPAHTSQLACKNKTTPLGT